MILSHQKFDFRDECLIEKVVVRAPFRFELDFPNDACFIHFQQGQTKINGPYEQVLVSSRESILLKCGKYFSDLPKQADESEYEIIVVHLSRMVLEEIYRDRLPAIQNATKKQDFIQKIDEQALISEFIKGLEFYFENPGLINDDLLELKVKELVLLLMQTRNTTSIEVLFRQIFSPSQVNISDVVNSYLYSEMAVKDLAYLCNMSESTFHRRFKEIFHDTPASYIREKRLQRARELLSIDTMSITEITFRIGFKDVSHLSRAFKSAFGYSPSEYRAKHF